VSPIRLNELYNQTIAGLALSFTNVSLAPDEMLAAGTIPVMNDSPYARAGLRNEHVRWVRPTPHALADALCGLVEAPNIAERARTVARSARTGGWTAAQSVIVQTIENDVYVPSLTKEASA
jgi:hypothetical protein